MLSDPQKKQRWDQGETLDEINGNGGGGGRGGGGMSQEDLFRHMSGMGGMGGGFRGGGFGAAADMVCFTRKSLELRKSLHANKMFWLQHIYIYITTRPHCNNT